MFINESMYLGGTPVCKTGPCDSWFDSNWFEIYFFLFNINKNFLKLLTSLYYFYQIISIDNIKKINISDNQNNLLNYYEKNLINNTKIQLFKNVTYYKKNFFKNLFFWKKFIYNNYFLFYTNIQKNLKKNFLFKKTCIANYFHYNNVFNKFIKNKLQKSILPKKNFKINTQYNYGDLSLNFNFKKITTNWKGLKNYQKPKIKPIINQYNFKIKNIIKYKM